MWGERICKLLGIKYPILQGAMAWIANAKLASAVSNAGGLGIIAAGNMPPEALKKEIDEIRTLTDRNWGINVYFLSPYVEEIMDLIIREKVPVITTGAGNPGKYIPMLKEQGTKVIPVVSSVVLAKRLERTGVDAVIAEGMECGGHIGEITTMALVPQVVDALSIPVLAAGGIADGRGLLAAFALGAEGVQVGTRFLCTEECTVHPKYKEAILKAQDRDTVITGARYGHPVRVLRNRLTRQMEKLEKTSENFEDFEKLGTGKLRAAVIEGDIENGSVMAGQIAGLVHNVEPVAKVIETMFSEADQLLNKLKQNNLGGA